MVVANNVGMSKERCRRPLLPLLLLAVIVYSVLPTVTTALSTNTPTPPQQSTGSSRRHVLQRSGLVSAVTTLGIVSTAAAADATTTMTTTPSYPSLVLTESASSSTTASTNGLAAKLAKKDPAVLKNSVFNIPPSAQVYPPFLRGIWNVSSRFGGFLFPSQTIPRDQLVQNTAIPGFQKCSIAATADVGKEQVNYQWKIDTETGLEDRAYTLSSQIDGYLGYKAVQSVLYNVKTNPNRLSIDFVDYKTVNAERIELFCNARESESFRRDEDVFVCSEYIRQVTFGTGSTVGVARQVGTNYANFWTWRRVGNNRLTGNLLTAAYLDPQDPWFFQEPAKPVAVYSHVLSAERVTV